MKIVVDSSSQIFAIEGIWFQYKLLRPNEDCDRFFSKNIIYFCLSLFTLIDKLLYNTFKLTRYT